MIRRLFLLGFSLVVALLVGLVLVEVLLRRAAPNVNLQTAALYRQSELGLELNPLAVCRVKTREFDCTLEVDASGLRRQYPEVLNPSCLVLGDSFTFGCWQSAGSTWIDLINQRLPGSTLNAGMPNAGTDWERCWLQSHPTPVRSVLLAFYTGNDFADNWMGFQSFRLVDGYLTLSRDTAERLKGPFPDDRPAKLPNSIQELALPAPGKSIPNVRTPSFLRSLHSYQWLRGLGKVRSLHPQRPEFWCQTRWNTAMREGVEKTWAELDAIFTICSQRNLHLSLIIIPSRAQVSDQEWQQIQGQFESLEREKPQKLIRQWCQARQVPFIDLLPELRNDCYLVGDPHWNSKGHRQVAQAVEPFLRKILEYK